MKTLKRTLSIILILVLVLSPFIVTSAMALALPNPYGNTFVGALGDKYDLLTQTEGEKIIVVGGSSVAFGIRSDIIAEYTDMQVVNFGLYAALGTKLMLDLSRDGVSRGDIVIVTPELDAQTLSLYFNSDMTLKAMGDRLDIFASIANKNKVSMLCKLWDYVAEKLVYFKKKLVDPSIEYPDPEGVYNSKNFNELGDLDRKSVV